MKLEKIKNEIVNYMLEFVVIEKIREVCYLFDNLVTIFQHEYYCGGYIDTIYSGSFAEGITNHGDYDIMYVDRMFLVVESADDVPKNYKGGVLIPDLDSCHAGYTRLLVHKKCDDKRFDGYISFDGKLYLNRMKGFNETQFALDFGYGIPHGPAFMITPKTGNKETDMVQCYQMLSNNVVQKRFANKEFYPSFQEQVPMILNSDCHIVPVAHAQSTNPDIEFRFSFSLIEKQLIQNWGIIQFKCYFLCKELIKHHLQGDRENEKGLCSYFAKTIIFWMTENNPSTYWEEHTTIELVDMILETMRGYLLKKCCPNYFIPENYMIDHYPQEDVNKLLVKIDSVRKDLFGKILECNFLNLEVINVFVSIYEVMVNMGDAHLQNSVLCSIFETGFVEKHNNEDKETCVRKKFYQHAHVYMLEFLRSNLNRYLTLYWNNDIPLHRSQETSNVMKALQHLTSDPILQRFAKVTVIRWLALMALTRFFDPDLKSNRSAEDTRKLWVDMEDLFLSQVELPEPLNDDCVSGAIYLALYYYLVGNKGKSEHILKKFVDIAVRNWKANFTSVPILFVSDTLLECPSFLQSEELLQGVFEEIHIHGAVRFYPPFFGAYLLYRITGDEKSLNLLKSLTSRHENFVCDTDASDYIRYKLSLLDETQMLDFASKIKSFECALCKHYESPQPNHHLNLMRWFEWSQMMTFLSSCLWHVDPLASIVILPLEFLRQFLLQ